VKCGELTAYIYLLHAFEKKGSGKSFGDFAGVFFKSFHRRGGNGYSSNIKQDQLILCTIPFVGVSFSNMKHDKLIMCTIPFVRCFLLMMDLELDGHTRHRFYRFRPSREDNIFYVLCWWIVLLLCMNPLVSMGSPRRLIWLCYRCPNLFTTRCPGVSTYMTLSYALYLTLLMSTPFVS